MMNSGALSWKSKLQTVNAHSTTDAEKCAATAAIKEIGYLRDALRRIGLPQATVINRYQGTTLYEDNEATCAIARTAAHREATKHLAIARCFVRYHHENGTVHFSDCTTQHQLADFLTKSLGAKLFMSLTNDAMGTEPILSKDKYARRDWRTEFDNKRYNIDTCVEEADPDTVPGGMTKAQNRHFNTMFKHKAIVNLVHMNSMKVDTCLCNNIHEYVCADIEDFIKMEQHQDQMRNDTNMTEFKHSNRTIAVIRHINMI